MSFKKLSTCGGNRYRKRKHETGTPEDWIPTHIPLRRWQRERIDAIARNTAYGNTAAFIRSLIDAAIRRHDG